MNYARWEGQLIRVGIGYDSHRFQRDRPLVIGGVEIEHDQGLAGHSDADVLTHAVIDALLGAAGLGDIGTHFPDDDPLWEGASSLEMAKKVLQLLREGKWSVVNIDATVILELPRLAGNTTHMCENLAGALGLPSDSVSVKATTNEGMGLVGRGEGAAAVAVTLIEKIR